MDERTLQVLSKALTLLIFHSGAAENLHMTGTNLDDAGKVLRLKLESSRVS